LKIIAITGNSSEVEAETPIRLVIVSSKLRNTSAIRMAIKPNVVFIQYKYYTSSLEGILGEYKCFLVEKGMITFRVFNAFF